MEQVIVLTRWSYFYVQSWMREHISYSYIVFIKRMLNELWTFFVLQFKDAGKCTSGRTCDVTVGGVNGGSTAPSCYNSDGGKSTKFHET